MLEDEGTGLIIALAVDGECVDREGDGDRRRVHGRAGPALLRELFERLLERLERGAGESADLLPRLGAEDDAVRAGDSGMLTEHRRGTFSPLPVRVACQLEAWDGGHLERPWADTLKK